MNRPVLFMQAVQSACKTMGPFDIAVEVGPHPALKSPAIQSILAVPKNTSSGGQLPYTGMLQRGKPAVETFGDGLGHVWSHLGKGHVDLGAYDAFMSGSRSSKSRRRIARGLPPYAWDHETEYWNESRYTRALLSRTEPVHPQLGHVTPDSTEQVTRWRNVLRPKEISWLKNHQLQGQTVFPAAGYIVLALEAALRKSGSKTSKRPTALSQQMATMLEVLDLEIEKALTFDQDDSSIEAVFTLSNVLWSSTADAQAQMTANFTYNAAAERDSLDLALLASGRICVSLDAEQAQDDNSSCQPAKANVLPARGPKPTDLLKVPTDDFYESLEKMGYDYSGPFRALSSIERMFGYATGIIENLVQEDEGEAESAATSESEGLIVHPAMLDAAFQATFVARAVPYDGGMWALHVPRKIRSIRVVPSLCAAAGQSIKDDDGAAAKKHPGLSFDAMLPADPASEKGIGGDVDLYLPQHAVVQVQGLLCVPFAPASPKDDRGIFSTTVWDVASPDAGRVGAREFKPTPGERELAHLLERVSVFYLRQLDRSVKAGHPARSSSEFSCLFKYAKHWVRQAENGALSFWKDEWNADTADVVRRACVPYAHVADIRLLHALGEELAAIATGDKVAIEIGMRDNMLSEYYQRSIGMDTYSAFMARTVKQIAHRHPHCHFLEIGGGTGGMTKHIFDEIESSYASYTFTDVSAGFLAAAQDLFNKQRKQHGMAFKVLDINRPAHIQGFRDNSYDVVVASMVLHATDTLEATLTNVRRLLRPGGYVVMLEALPDVAIRSGTIFGAFPGWWAGSENNDRSLSPLVSVERWDALLRKTGFAGCDSVTPTPEPVVAPFMVIAAQAVNDQVSMLRGGLSASITGWADNGFVRLMDDLIIVAGKSPNSRATRLASNISALAESSCTGSVTTVRSWGEIDPESLSDKTTVLSLSDLDNAFFTSPALESWWDSLRGTLVRIRTLLWVTHSRRDQNPHANMMVGLLRSAASEMPTLDVESLDFPNAEEIQPRVVLETLLRFRAVTTWQRDGTAGGLSGLVTTAEPEIQLDRDGWPLIPRLVPNRQMNERYNTSRRDVWETVKLGGDKQTSVRVGLNHEKGEYSLWRGRPLTQALQETAGPSVLRVSHSLLEGIRVAESTKLILALGKSTTTGDQAVFLSDELASHAAPAWDDLSMLIEVETGLEDEFLENVAYHMLASVILKGVGKDDRIVVLESDPNFANVLTWRARNIGARVTFITFETENAARHTPWTSSWLRVHPMAATRDVQKLVPKNVAVYVDLASQLGHENTNKDAQIRSALPSHCRLESRLTLFGIESGQGNSWWTPRVGDVRARLQDAVNHALHSLAEGGGGGTAALPVNKVDIGDVASYSKAGRNENHPVTILDWTGTPEVTVQVQPVDSQVSLDPNKTYWLAGLSHGLGLSLCEWMIRRGARHVAISSRRPNVDASWLAKVSRTDGAVVRVLECDMTSEADVRRAYGDIRANMPPVAGVAQGAMVLDDVLIADMTLDQLVKATRPKVEGSVHLERLFRGDDGHDNVRNPPLDFFVFFSSYSSVTGWQGQANYAAANLFMGALAEQRRLKGLAASVINIGPVLGVGYIAQNARTDLRWRVEARETWFVSETDFLAQFTEAIVAGRPGTDSDGATSAGQIEITTGIERIGAHGGSMPSWATNPILSHCLVWNDEDGGTTAHGATANPGANGVVPIKTRLAQASTRDAVFAAVHDVFVPKLAALFQRPAADLAREDPAHLQLSEMGTDSLLATEIRTWFIKTLQVSIPVLRILSGASVKELCVLAAETLPPAWIPEVKEADSKVSADAWVPPSLSSSTEAVPVVAVPDAPEAKHEPESNPEKDITTHQDKTVSFQSHQAEKGPDDGDSSSTSARGCDTPGALTGNFSMNDTASSVSSKGPPTTDGDVADHKNQPFDSIISHTEQGNDPQQHFDKVAPLSFTQATFWFVLSFLKDKSSPNNTASFQLTGRIRQDDFERALQIIIQRHDILRACFFESEGQAMQGFLPESRTHGEYRTIRSEQDLRPVVQELERHVFDLARGENLRVVLLTLTPTRHFLVLSSHALVADGMSVQIFLREMQQLFAKALPPPPAQYATHAIKQHVDYLAGRWADDLGFWRAEYPPEDFPDALPIFRLGQVTARPQLTSYENERAEMRLGRAVKARVKALCRGAGVTPFHFYLTVFRALLAQLAGNSGVQDVSIGIADAHRTEDDFAGTYGPFVNLLPLRFRNAAQGKEARENNFKDALRETRAKVLSALAHSGVPFQVLLTELGAPRSASHTPIFQCLVDYRVGQRPKADLSADVELEIISYALERVAYDVALDVIDDPDVDGDCTFMLIVRKDLYSRRDAESLLASYERLVKAFVDAPSMGLDEPDAYEPAGVDRALAFGRGAEKERLWPETLVLRVEEVTKERGDETAVRWSSIGGGDNDNDETFTCAQLRDRIEDIALALANTGIGAASRVAVLQEPTGDWIASILAIMRLGAVYLPLDQNNPWSRLATITRDCRPEVVLVDNDTEQHVEKLDSDHLKAINVAGLMPDKSNGRRNQNLSSIAATADKVATILYTSGSTGTPKGIVLKHEGLCNWLEFTAEVYDLKQGETVLQQSAPGFDMSMIQIFTALCLGGTLCLVPRALRGDAAALVDMIITKGVTYTMSCASETFSWFRFGNMGRLAKSKWRRAVIAGEPGVHTLFKDFVALQKPELRVFHSYGPTETSWTATSMELPYRDYATHVPNKIAVGRPILNYTVYILDEHLRPVPPGIQGEVYIGGPGVASGYLNNGSMTAERFVPDMFASSEERRRGRRTLHRAGDLGRWGPEGELFLEGRVAGDTQVKLRGLRIDLQEIERALLDASEGMLSEVVVSVRRGAPTGGESGTEGPSFLVAHVVLKEAYNADKFVLGNILSKLGLPRYMTPAVIIPLAHMPLTTSSKLDRRAIAALPLPEGREAGVMPKLEEHETHAGMSETEAQLKGIWQDVILGKTGLSKQSPVGPETDFFHVGGTSLLLLDLRRRIQTRWDVQLRLVDMFDASTLTSMALAVDNERVRNGVTKQANGNAATTVSEIIDWDQETALPPSLLQHNDGGSTSASEHSTFVPRLPSKLTIILTGATGYLGNGILRSLIADPRVKRIHCLAVRDPGKLIDATAGSKKARAKVVIHEGDLMQPRLGLQCEVSEIGVIFDTADAAIHNGADVSYLKTYASLRAPNVAATKALAELCLARKIPFHYVSSVGACAFAAAAGRQSNGSVAAWPPPSDSGAAPGYFSSKWASEMFLEKLGQEHPGWRVVVHRPSNISRSDGEDAPGMDLVHNIRHYARDLGAVPVVPVPAGEDAGALNSVSLETVVEGVLGDVLGSDARAGQDEEDNGPGVRFVHHLGELELPMDDLRRWFGGDGDGFEGMDIPAWTDKAVEWGMHPTVAALEYFGVRRMDTVPK
ncbi:NRPS [Diaporthe eres]